MGAAGGKQHMMTVTYSRGKGRGVPGTEVTKAKDWLIEVLQHEHVATKAYFDSIPEGNQRRVLALFDDDDVFEGPGVA